MRQTKSKEFWIVDTDKGVVFADEEEGIKKFWLGGSVSTVFVPIFESKVDAEKFRRKVSKSKNVVWTKKIRAKIIKEGN